ncbi:hypothetical protein [Thiocapsa sp. UBA6158]|jgi:hypothetical protein|uniref:hypothetical protein n=1 Tax=Thiocapsa sp. UBA6158 TaxID=1947692 RepID=UPI0025FBE8DF|nr:hypothetical protein [Thiocapsa sp. UBA6158]
MRELLISTVATGVLLLGLMGTHTPTPPPETSSALHPAPVALHADPAGLPTTAAQSAS